MKLERWNAETDGNLTEQALRGKLEKAGYSVSRYVYPRRKLCADDLRERQRYPK